MAGAIVAAARIIAPQQCGVPTQGSEPDEYLSQWADGNVTCSATVIGVYMSVIGIGVLVYPAGGS